MEAPHDIVEALFRWQRASALDDRQLARVLQVSASTICRLRSGQRAPGIKLLNAIGLGIPELHPLIVKHILGGNGQE